MRVRLADGPSLGWIALATAASAVDRCAGGVNTSQHAHRRADRGAAQQRRPPARFCDGGGGRVGRFREPL